MPKIVDLIKYEGDNTTFVWKHPCEDFNVFSQLIVHESQEAVFFRHGKIIEVFGPGRYSLETYNFPIIGKLINNVVGGDSPFHCEVYFVNKTEQMAIKWGTDSQVQYVEPIYGFPVSIGASGDMNLRVEDSRKLLTKIVGTEDSLTRERLVFYFRSFLMARVKTYMPQVIKNNSISIFELHENLDIFSDGIKNLLIPDFMEYGVSLEQFFVTNVAKPDGDPQYEKFKELHFRQYADIAEAKLRQQTDLIYAETEAQKTVIASKAMATKREQEGYTYQQERGFDVATVVAQNEAVGELTNLGIGLGTMAGVGGAVGGMVGGMMNDAVASTTPVAPAAPAVTETTSVEEKKVVCPKCGAVLPEGAKFCFLCGEKFEAEPDSNKVICRVCGKETPKGKFCIECGASLENKCPKCGAVLPEGAKFCLECGASLENKCPKCGAKFPAGAKFCLECGEKL